MPFRKYLILPKLLSLTLGAPRDRGRAWETFWSRVRHTGEGGQVLWDMECEEEMTAARERLRAHLDLSLPIVDVGCGNGRHTRMLAGLFPHAIGVDVSASATLLAQTEARGISNISFRAWDMTEKGAGERFFQEMGPVNVYLRGVLHILPHEPRRVLVENVARMLGDRGMAYLIESDFEGDPLAHLVHQGATPTSFPEPLRLSIESGLRPPEHFGRAELMQYFPTNTFRHVISGATKLYTLPMVDKTRRRDELSALYAIVHPHRS